jgi:hypothetical protein
MAGIIQKFRDMIEEKYPKGEKPGKASKKRNDEPAEASEPGPMAAHVHQKVLATNQAAGTLTVALQNKTTSATVYAYITGLAIDRNNAPMFIQSDGRTAYFPTSPSQPGGT